MIIVIPHSYIELIVLLSPGLLSLEITFVLYTPICVLEKSCRPEMFQFTWLKDVLKENFYFKIKYLYLKKK